MDYNRKVRDSSKPCPFCGKKPKLNYDASHYRYKLGCKGTNCSIRPQVPYLIDPNNVNDLNMAIALWNKRAE